MRDACVRAAVRSMLGARHASELDVVIADELPADRASARIDVAVLNGHLHGFEIKSDRDTLDRLPRQAASFSAAMQAMTLVAATRHVARSVAMVPDWWSVLEARATSAGGVRLVRLRRGRRNRQPDPAAMARLLERAELLAVLHRHGIDRGVRTASYAAIAERVCSLPAATVADEVLTELKFRARWEAAREATAFGRSVLDINPPATAVIGVPATSCAGWP